MAAIKVKRQIWNGPIAKIYRYGMFSYHAKFHAFIIKLTFFLPVRLTKSEYTELIGMAIFFKFQCHLTCPKHYGHQINNQGHLEVTTKETGYMMTVNIQFSIVEIKVSECNCIHLPDILS